MFLCRSWIVAGMDRQLEEGQANNNFKLVPITLMDDIDIRPTTKEMDRGLQFVHFN